MFGAFIKLHFWMFFGRFDALHTYYFGMLMLDCGFAIRFD
jgi:hypothetical protein